MAIGDQDFKWACLDSDLLPGIFLFPSDCLHIVLMEVIWGNQYIYNNYNTFLF